MRFPIGQVFCWWFTAYCWDLSEYCIEYWRGKSHTQGTHHNSAAVSGYRQSCISLLSFAMEFELAVRTRVGLTVFPACPSVVHISRDRGAKMWQIWHLVSLQNGPTLAVVSDVCWRQIKSKCQHPLKRRWCRGYWQEHRCSTHLFKSHISSILY